MARSAQFRIYYYSLWDQLSTTYRKVTEVTQWAASSCSQPPPVTFISMAIRSSMAVHNGFRDGKSNNYWLAATLHPLQGNTNE